MELSFLFKEELENLGNYLVVNYLVINPIKCKRNNVLLLANHTYNAI